MEMFDCMTWESDSFNGRDGICRGNSLLVFSIKSFEEYVLSTEEPGPFSSITFG